MLESLLVEGDAGEAQKIVLEIVQIPGDGLAVEAGARIADLVIEVAACLDLKARQHGDDFAIGFDGGRSDGVAGAIRAEEFKERGVAQVFFEVGALSSNPPHKSPAPAGRGGESAGRTRGRRCSLRARDTRMPMALMATAGEADDGAPRAAELALERLRVLSRELEMLLEKPL